MEGLGATNSRTSLNMTNPSYPTKWVRWTSRSDHECPWTATAMVLSVAGCDHPRGSNPRQTACEVYLLPASHVALMRGAGAQSPPPVPGLGQRVRGRGMPSLDLVQALGLSGRQETTLDLHLEA